MWLPAAKILALFHSGTGLLVDVTAVPLRSHEMARVEAVHPALKAGDVLVDDRGFCSLAHLALLLGRGVRAVFRIHQKQIVDFAPGRAHAAPGAKDARAGLPRSRWVRALRMFDQVVEWFKPVKRPKWVTEEQHTALPEKITVREARYTIARLGFRTWVVTLVTTLLDAEAYPGTALAELYGARWRVEQNLRDLKQTMKMDVLRCKTVDGVFKELTAYAIVYNLARAMMCEAAPRRGRGTTQLHRRSALAARCRAGRHAAGVGGESIPAWACRAPCTEAEAEAVFPHETAVVNIA